MTFAFSAAVAVAGLLFITPASAAETPPKLLRGEAPAHPFADRKDGNEGWVLLRFAVSKDGKPDNIRVARSYPKGVFDATAVNALKTYTFQPKMVDGVAVEESSHAFRFLFVLDDSRSVDADHFKLFRDVQRSVRAGDKAAADAGLEKLNALYDQGRFNLTEIARYYELAGLVLNTRQQYIEASEFIEAALRLSDYFDDPKVIDTLHAQMLFAFVNVGQYHNAVDYYVSWGAKTNGKGPATASKQIIAAVEKLQKEGYGRARSFEIAVYVDPGKRS